MSPARHLCCRACNCRRFENTFRRTHLGLNLTVGNSMAVTCGYVKMMFQLRQARCDMPTVAISRLSYCSRDTATKVLLTRPVSFSRLKTRVPGLRMTLRSIYLLLRRSSKQWTKSYSTTQHSTIITNQERNLYTQ